jgi:hypothetical protein
MRQGLGLKFHKYPKKKVFSFIFLTTLPARETAFAADQKWLGAFFYNSLEKLKLKDQPPTPH